MITTTEINKLKRITNIGLIDCKNALVESNGDFNMAIDILRKKGNKVSTTSYKEHNEGVVVASVNSVNTIGVIISLNCESKELSESESFIKLANSLANTALKYNTKEEFVKNISNKLIEQTKLLGEKIVIGSFERLEGHFIELYNHRNKIATLTSLSKRVEEANISMQIASMNPLAINENDIDSNIINREIEIYKEQFRAEGKPEAMLEKIAQGKLNQFYKENTLLKQAYIKDSSISVAQYIKSINLSILDFKRLSI